MAASAQLYATDYVKYGYEGEWIQAGTIPELFSQAPVAPPPVAPVAPVTPAAPVAPTTVTFAPAGTPVSTAAPAVVGGAVTLAETERQILMRQVLEMLQQQGMPLAAPAPAAESGWYCQIGGNTVGPMAIDALVQMVVQKRLFADDQIRLGNTGEWFPAKSVPELFPDEAAAVAKKRGADDGSDLLARVEKMYADAEVNRLKDEAKAAATSSHIVPAKTVQKTEVSRSKLAGEAIRNLNASIVRHSGAPKESSSGEGSSMGEQFKELCDKLHIPPVVLVSILGLGLAIGGLYYFAPGMFSTFGDGSRYTALLAFQKELDAAVSSNMDPAAWKAKEAALSGKAKDLLRSLATRTDPQGRVLRSAANLSLTLSNELASNSAERDKKLEFNRKSLNDSLKQAAKFFK